MSLNNAPKHIQLAVDLIQLLEENQIDTATAVAALEVVLTDCKQKQSFENNTSNAS
ncbi:YbaM family protein [Motilimonas cestriensis]|uniref:YbaM family protein n=1 Tax=Motilimonas cestriensis TaxID=2742685 RepID=A0ABS8WB62_9GAMM|nr:YbaM family protein [Motilimonas cestriensis]MCE2595720.1 YbaM family protein [Motilimonas cestriensis]